MNDRLWYNILWIHNDDKFHNGKLLLSAQIFVLIIQKSVNVYLGDKSLPSQVYSPNFIS